MHFISRRLFLTALLSVALSGCASQKPVDKLDLATPDDDALKELINISIEARDEMRILAKTQEAMAQKAMTKAQHEQRYYQATVVPKGFDKAGDFSYVGKASKAAEALALLAGYEFHVDGKKHMNEPWVHIHIKDEPLNEALKELGLQTGDAIRIELHSKVMRFIYK